MGDAILDGTEGYQRVIGPINDVVLLPIGVTFAATRGLIFGAGTVGGKKFVNLRMATGEIRNNVPVVDGMFPLRVIEVLSPGPGFAVWGIY